MTTLYNCKHDGDQFRITKFNEHFEVESSYLCTESECECPAGHRRMCRHREMVPRFNQREHVGDNWFFDYDRGGWVHGPEQEQDQIEDTTEIMPELASEASTTPADTMPPLPEGVQMFGMDDVLGIHNAIAEAVGEPEAIIPVHPRAKSWRRF